MSEQNRNEEHDVPIAGHDYDGIQELDNNLPRWWVIMFWLCIVHSIGYVAYYEFLGGPSLAQTYAVDQAKIDEASKAHQASGPTGPTDEQLNAASKDQASKDLGKAVYVRTCVSCHGPEGQGVVGPNLTDNFWIHGAKPADIFNVVAKGVLDKGMPPWEAQLKAEELIGVVAYVKSIHGTNPVNPKAPQGTEVKD